MKLEDERKEIIDFHYSNVTKLRKIGKLHPNDFQIITIDH